MQVLQPATNLKLSAGKKRVWCAPLLPKQRGLRDEIERELAARLAEQEEERERVLREAEEERRRDREEVEEVREPLEKLLPRSRVSSSCNISLQRC